MDPEVKTEPKQEQEPEVKTEQEVKPEVKKSNYTYRGEELDHDRAAQLEYLVELGAKTLQEQEDNKKKEIEKAKEDDAPDKKIEKLELELAKIRQDYEGERILNQINTKISKMSSSDAFLKANPELTEEIRDEVLMRILNAPKVTLEDHFKNVINKEKKKAETYATKYAKDKLEDKEKTQGDRGGSGTYIPSGDKTTGKDVMSGKLRKRIMDQIYGKGE